jgi:glutamate racemase
MKYIMHYWGLDEDAETRFVSPIHGVEHSEHPFPVEYIQAEGLDPLQAQTDAQTKEHAQAPIGVFDSGAGGLTILSALRQELPQEHYVYFGDTGHCPYGTRSEVEITELATRACRFLIKQGVKLIVVACNTASQAALNTLRATFALPFVGVVPAVKPAARFTKRGRIGVAATNQAARATYLRQLIDDYASGVQVYAVGCPELVTLVEHGDFDGPLVEETLQQSLRPLLVNNIDVLVLGCTHFPALRKTIEKVVGPHILVIDSSAAIARRTHSILDVEGIIHPTDTRHKQGQLQVWCSGDTSAFSLVASKLLGYSVQAQQAIPK